MVDVKLMSALLTGLRGERSKKQSATFNLFSEGVFMSLVLSAEVPNLRVVLVGDPDQLPPIGPGLPLLSLMRADAVPCVQLTKVFRQQSATLVPALDSPSSIIRVAAQVRTGQPPAFSWVIGRKIEDDGSLGHGYMDYIRPEGQASAAGS